MLDVKPHLPMEQPNFLHSREPIAEKLDRARLGLLDLSARNRLLNVPLGSKGNRSIEVIDERSSEVLRLLVREDQAFTFLAGRASSKADENAQHDADELDEIRDLVKPEDNSVDERGVLKRHADSRLQTRLTSKSLQKRLLEMYSDAITLEQEQGVNILFLALGMLKWVHPTDQKLVRHAPLVLVPVALSRTTAADRFKLSWRHEEISSNLSLEAYLDREHRLKLPGFDGGDEFDIAHYCERVAETISQKEGWEVLQDNITLGFFSFAKFLMYRDLDSDCWPADSKLTEQPLIKALLAEGFPEAELGISDDGFVDAFLRPAEMLHVADADSSQTKAIYEVRQGRSLVIQGPPGTGKSQTIANIIATAVADGKTVLFVAEKMVALDVVKSRLDRIGVGDACLELHSNKANKRAVLQELRRTWELGSPQATIPPTLNSNLLQVREQLNAHAASIHREHPVAQLSPFQVVGELANLARQGREPVDFSLQKVETWTPDDVEQLQNMVGELAARVSEIGSPAAHPWRGVQAPHLLPTDVARLLQIIQSLRDRVASAADRIRALGSVLHADQPATFQEWDALHDLSRRIATAPALSAAALTSPAWTDSGPGVEALLGAGKRYTELAVKLTGVLIDGALQSLSDSDVAALDPLPPSLQSTSWSRLERLKELTTAILAAFQSLQRKMGVEGYDAPALHDARSLLSTAKGVAEAPSAPANSLMSPSWIHGLERAADLAEAAAVLERSQSSLREKVAPAAWETNLGTARQTLASHGDSLFRHLSGDWRAANRLVRSILTNVSLPTAEVLSVLDEVQRGQEARKRLLQDRDFGRDAFGDLWRDDRSNADALQAIVAWLRGLGVLRDKVRMITAAVQDRSAVAREYASLDALAIEASAVIAKIEPGLIDVQEPLALLERRLGDLTDAERRTRSLFLVPPHSLQDRIGQLHLSQEMRDAQKHIGANHDLGLALFDVAWASERSDWAALQSAASWKQANHAIAKVVAELADRTQPSIESELLLSDRSATLDAWNSLLKHLCATDDEILAAGQAPDTMLQRLDAWLAHPEQLSKWTAYVSSLKRASDKGLDDITQRLLDGRVFPDEALPTFAMAYFEALLKSMFQDDPALEQFDGEIHRGLANRFTELDRARIAVSAVEVVKAHHRRIPPGGGIGPVGILRGEIVKRSKHLPLRQLMHKAGPVVQALKPVLMMSPLSIAQFLPPGELTFDLLVMDEASQIQPVDALGAVARCRQVVVVGDERQLPPTRFFAKMTSAEDEDNEDEDDSTRVGDVESVLGLFIARGLPQRMLRWHYRSRHQSLIAVSNSEFYENKLFVIPSPVSQEGGRGLQFKPVENGVFYSEAHANAGRFANPIEAGIVAEAVMRHAKEHPGLSLGVATFSTRQRRAILDQVESLRRLNPDTEPFFNGHSAEPFFIKNLENVQGDERDVIFISVGYGPDPQGKFALRFGPLGMDGGERRLNVLISRAKLRCVVYASITDEHIDTDKVKSKGVFALKLFLHFARTGRLDMVRTPEVDRQKSTFVAQAATALREHGYTVHEQVGTAGCFVDMGVIDPDHPGRYALGIEVDGPSYSLMKSSRDRDRLRREVLEGHGWVMHRVWCIDWLHRPKEQLQRCLSALLAEKERLSGETSRQVDKREQPVEIVTVAREDAVEMSLSLKNDRGETMRYVEARIPRPVNLEFHDTPVSVLADSVCRVVDFEGPVHESEVVIRLREIWELKRTGTRIQAMAEGAIRAAKLSGRVVAEGSFLQVPGRKVVPRDRSQVRSLTLRKPDMLPPQEVQAAVLVAIRSSFGGTREEIVQAVAKFLGYQTKGATLRTSIEEVILGMWQVGTLYEHGGLLKEREEATA